MIPHWVITVVTPRRITFANSLYLESYVFFPFSKQHLAHAIIGGISITLNKVFRIMQLLKFSVLGFEKEQSESDRAIQYKYDKFSFLLVASLNQQEMILTGGPLLSRTGGTAELSDTENMKLF